MLLTGHIVSIIIGFSATFYTGVLIIRNGVKRPFDRSTYLLLQTISRVTLVGLFLLWATGFGLAYQAYQINPDYVLKDMFLAKVSIFSILSANALLLSLIVARLDGANQSDSKLMQNETARTVTLTSTYCITMASWIILIFTSTSTWLGDDVGYQYVIMRWLFTILVTVAVALVAIAIRENLFDPENEKSSTDFHSPSLRQYSHNNE